MWTFLLISILVAVSSSFPTNESSQSCETTNGFELCEDASGVLKVYPLEGEAPWRLKLSSDNYTTCTLINFTVTSESFQNLSAVNHINLECVILFSEENPFENFTHLNELSFGRNEFTEFPRELCANIPNLMTINMKDQRIRTLSPSSFSGITEELDELNLESIELEFIEPQTFARFSRLSSLVLVKNRLEKLRSGMFDGLTELGMLSLDHNQLNEIEPGSFSSFNQLDTLIMDNNRLESLPAGIFDDLKDLTYLGLYGNPLSSLSYNWLHGHQLSFLTLGFSDKIQIEPDLFRGLNLTMLILNADELTPLKAGAFSGLSTDTLLLNSNPNNTFDFVPNLFEGTTVIMVNIHGDAMSSIDLQSWGLGENVTLYSMKNIF